MIDSLSTKHHLKMAWCVIYYIEAETNGPHFAHDIQDVFSSRFNFRLNFHWFLFPIVQLTAIWAGVKPLHDDVIKWKHFPRYWHFVRGIHRWPMNSPHKGQWRGALMFSLICTWINAWVNNREAGDLRRHSAHYDVTVMIWTNDHLAHLSIYASLAFDDLRATAARM